MISLEHLRLFSIWILLSVESGIFLFYDTLKTLEERRLRKKLTCGAFSMQLVVRDCLIDVEHVCKKAYKGVVYVPVQSAPVLSMEPFLCC